MAGALDRRRSERPCGPRLLVGALLVALIVASCATAPDPSAAPRDTQAPSATIAPSPTGEEPGAGKVYLAAGDSLTFGIGVPAPQRNGFVASVVTGLAAATPPITRSRVLAVPGETATSFLDRRLDDLVRAIEALGPRVGLVSIGLGANELLRTRRAPPCVADRTSAACDVVLEAALAAAAESLDAIVAAVQATLLAEGSDARVLLLAYYAPDPDEAAARSVVGSDGAVDCDPAEAFAGLDDRIACIAERRGAEIVDLYAAFQGREAELTRFRAGDVHPNQAGYDRIAEEILRVVGDPPSR